MERGDPELAGSRCGRAGVTTVSYKLYVKLHEGYLEELQRKIHRDYLYINPGEISNEILRESLEKLQEVIVKKLQDECLE